MPNKVKDLSKLGFKQRHCLICLIKGRDNGKCLFCRPILGDSMSNYMPTPQLDSVREYLTKPVGEINVQ